MRDGWPPSRQAQNLRVLVLGWCLWLLGAWAASLLIDSPVPATRWMIFSSLIGLMAMWPTVRLSMDERAAQGRAQDVVREWLALFCIFQVVIWSLALTARWGFAQTVWLDCAVGAWSLMTALLLTVAVHAPHRLLRLLVATLCLLLLVGEPLVLTMVQSPGADHRWFLRVSPIETVWALTEVPIDFASGPWQSNVRAAGVAVGSGWVIYGLIRHTWVRDRSV